MLSFTSEVATLIRYVDPKYPVYVTSGATGNGESMDDCSKQYNASRWSFSAVRNNDIGFSSFRAYNATHFEFDHYSVTNGKIVDNFWLVRSKPPYAAQLIAPK